MMDIDEFQNIRKNRHLKVANEYLTQTDCTVCL